MAETFSKYASLKEEVVQAAKQVAQWVKNNPHQIAGGAIGGGLAGLGTYLVSKPGKDGLSADQKGRKLKKPAKDESFAGGMSRITSNTAKEVADLAAKHPGAMALSSVPSGVALGRLVATKIKGASVMEKLSAAEKFELADSWGRSMARQQYQAREELYAAVEKVAESKTKTSAGTIGPVNMDTAKALGRNALAGVTKLIRKHPVKSTLGALAVGRYMMPKKDRES